MLAKLAFLKRVWRVSDPMSGFFVVRRERLTTGELQPHGFKILLEGLVRAAPLQVVEVPYTFGERCAGDGKACPREGLRYLRHLARLRLPSATLRPGKFGLVGLSGLLVNTLLLAALTEEVGLFYLLAALVATELSIVWNFGLSEAWVFRDKAGRGGRSRRFASFAAVNNAAFALGVPLLWLLVTVGGLQYLLGNLVSISVLVVARFLLSDKLIWRNHANVDSPAAAPAWRARAPGAGAGDSYRTAAFDYRRGDDSSYRHSPAALGLGNPVGIERIPRSDLGSFLRPGTASGSPGRAQP